MELIDLVLQGIKKFVQSQKIPFKPGLNLIFGGNESGKSTLFNCLQELLFPTQSLEEDWISWKGGEQSRAGLTFKQGEIFYRVFKDFSQNRISLSRKPPGTDKFERLSTEPTEIVSILAEELNLPGYEDYKTLFLESRLWLPSHTGIEPPKPVPSKEKVPAQSPPGNLGGTNVPGFGMPGYPGMAPPGYGYPGMPMAPGFSSPGYMGMPGMPGMPVAPGMGASGYMGMPGLGMPGGEMLGEDDGMSWEEKEKRLEKLKAELGRVKEVEELHFELDGYQAKVFELQKEKEKVLSIDKELKELEEGLSKYRFFTNLPENIDQRIAQYNSLESNRGKELEGIDEKMADLDAELRALEAEPKFYQRLTFKIGLGLLVVGILGIIVSSFLELKWLSTIGVLIAPALLLLGITLWQFLNQEGKKGELRTNLKNLEEQRRRVIKEYEVKGALVKKLLEKTDCSDTEELNEMLNNYRELEARRDELSRKKKELLLELDWERLNKEEAELKGKISELETKLKKFAGIGLDINEMRREIETLERSLERARQLGLIAKKEEAGVSELKVEPGKTQVVSALDRSELFFWERIFDSGARLLGVEVEQLWSQTLGRANLYLQTLSGKRYLEINKREKKLFVRRSEVEKELELNEAGTKSFDLVFFSLKFALLELVLQKYPLPMILDDPYVLLDENSAVAVGKILKRLSANSQVVLFSSQRLFAREASQALALS